MQRCSFTNFENIFCNENLFKTIELKSLKEFVNQDVTKTYVNNNSDNNIHWFINEESYVELGEKMVGLLKSDEFYTVKNYNHKDIYSRFFNQIIVTSTSNTTDDVSLEVLEEVHEKKIKVL